MASEPIAPPTARLEPHGRPDVQSHLLRTAKVPVFGQSGRHYSRRDWSLHCFFRIMPDIEVTAFYDRLLGKLHEAGGDGGAGFAHACLSPVEHAAESEWACLALDLAQPAHLFAGHAAEKQEIEVDHFRAWLNLLVHQDKPAAARRALELAQALERAEIRPLTDELAARMGVPNPWKGVSIPLGSKTKKLAKRLNETGAKLFPSRDAVPDSPLLRLVAYEAMRQVAPALSETADPPLIRSEAKESERNDQEEAFDETPITLAFTWSGLKALQIDPATLDTFPEPFRDGMAARAARLKDMGPSAPENWEGVLGLDVVHGFFTGGSNLHGARPEKEEYWKRLRREIRAYNEPSEPLGHELRARIGLISRMAGLEILHIELGQDPYEVKDGRIVELDQHFEHFGFRDGLSQPFVDLGLGDPLPGGGTPSRSRTWAPVAPGEIFLDQKDEDGDRHDFPANADLRKGSTYLVVRKLEQDVHGFHEFLSRQRPGDPQAQALLGAQFMGRWPDGTPLTLSPSSNRPANQLGEAALNDFLYEADDPFGRKCPLGAHIRRANPRDTGGRNNVRHHRILRRGISYGGPLIARGATDDDCEKKGLLFIAACARLDVQFEVIQGDWLNSGEFLGQAGLGRCPISGSQQGGIASRFLESGATAPITGLPTFVTMRGGDYFFAPGVSVLQSMAQGERFPPPSAEEGARMGQAMTPTLFSDERMKLYGRRLLGTTEKVIRVRGRTSAAAGGAGPAAETIGFVGKYDDVCHVLSDGAAFSVSPYREAGNFLTRGDDFPVGTDAENPHREILFLIMNRAWKWLEDAHGGEKAFQEKLSRTVGDHLNETLRRTAGARRLDLVGDLAVPAAYGVIRELFGLPGPKWVTEIAAAMPFARQRVTEIPRDWLAARRDDAMRDPGLVTMQIWMAIIVADLIGNVQDQRPIKAFSRQAGLEALSHIDQQLALAWQAAALEAAGQAARDPDRKPTLVDAFIALAKEKDIAELYQDRGRMSAVEARWETLYRRDVAIILLELLGSTMTIVPMTFASVMTALLDFRIDPATLIPTLDREAVERLIHEAERLEPNVGLRPRRCRASDALPGIEKGDFVAALIEAANMDPRVWERRTVFSLGGERAPKRDLDKYLLFGVQGSAKTCWGRDRVALPILTECLYACGRLQGLRRIAGKAGAVRKLAGVKIGLPARFTSVKAGEIRRR